MLCGFRWTFNWTRRETNKPKLKVINGEGPLLSKSEHNVDVTNNGDALSNDEHLVDMTADDDCSSTLAQIPYVFAIASNLL